MSSPSATNFNKVKTLLVFLFIILSNGVAAQNDISVTHVGAILDINSRIGTEQKIAMEIAAAKFNKSDSHKLKLHFRNSEGNPFLAASAAEELMKKQKVQVIVGMEYWPEAVQVADQVRNQSQVVPVISFGAPLITPPQIPRWPFLIRMTSNGSAQMNCIADIVAAYSWKRVVVIYEDDGYGGYVGLLALLSEALQDANAKIEHHLVLPRVVSPASPASPANWDDLEELLKLPTFQSRVFIVLQSSLPTLNNLFKVAKKMGLVGRESAWILTECITSLLDPQGNPDMEGVLGVKTYYEYYPNEKNSSYVEFEKEFQAKYVNNSKPGIYTLRAYDTLGVISQAIETLERKLSNTSSTTSLQEMITKLLSNYSGLSGNMHFKEGEALLDSLSFRIVNIVDGKMNTELNFWKPNFGFSEGLNTARVYVSGNVTWPGKLRRTPKGWTMPSVEKPMIIGVPGETSFSKFVKVGSIDNPDDITYDGFCIQIFYKVLSRLNYSLPYEFHAHIGTYDQLVEKVQNKTYDAVVGDMTVLAGRMDKVEFTQPYMGSGLSMIVAEVTDKEAAWMFMKPFTWQMWVVTGSVLIYTMLIVWFLEYLHPSNSDFKGPWKDQLSTAVWFTFSSLFFAHREKVNSNLTRVLFIVWLFVVLILTSSYTANLSSMLTIQRLQPNVTDLQMLRNTNATVGLDGDSFVYKYMRDVLKFLPDNMKNVSSEYNYTDMFKNKEISAAFLEVPYAEVFMNKYCEGYTSTNPIYRFGGLSFMFQKGSPFARDFTRAILELLESGEIKKLQNEWLTPQEECKKNSTSNRPESLSLDSFSGLYVISVVTSSFCLLLYLAIWMRRFQQQEANEGNASPSNENIWKKTVGIVKLFRLRDLEVPSRAPTFASYIVDWTTPRWGEYLPTSNTPEQPPVFLPAEIECVPVEQAVTRV